MDAFSNNKEPSGRAQSEPAINAPAVVLALGAVLIAVHLVIQFLPKQTADWTVLALAFIPARYGGAEFAMPGGVGADFWSFITHMFLHADWLHLGINVLFMAAFGSVLAKRFGAVRFLMFSALAGIGGALAHLFSYWGEFVPVIGASGAISGQMAGAVRLLFAQPQSIFAVHRQDPATVRALTLSELLRSRRALTFLAVWIGLMIFTGAGNMFAPDGVSIAWQAHLGGFLVGLFVFDRFDPLRHRASTLEQDGQV
ncbi:MAG: rhomboid family intramembrane serine protease [Hyphomicrobiales bacterium]